MLDSGGGRGFGRFDKALSFSDETPVIFVVYYPAIDESEPKGPLPQTTIRVYVDINDLYTKKDLQSCLVKMANGSGTILLIRSE